MQNHEQVLWFQREHSGQISWTLGIKDDGERADRAAEAVLGFSTPFNVTTEETGGVRAFSMTPVSIWNYIARGGAGSSIVEEIEQYAGRAMSPRSREEIVTLADRWGKIKLVDGDDEKSLVIQVEDGALLDALLELDPRLKAFKIGKTNEWKISRVQRGRLKQAFTWYGFPVLDEASRVSGLPLEIAFREEEGFVFRDYQETAVDSLMHYHKGPQEGVVISPCGSGKTIMALGLIVATGVHTLVVVTNIDAMKQFRSELLTKTTIKESDIGEYYGAKKQVRSITLTTYSTLTRLQSTVLGAAPLRQRLSNCFGVPGEDVIPAEEFDRRLSSLELFAQPGWGLVIFDEAHVIPANQFRLAAHIQSIGRSGFTATPVREDGREGDIFSLIGPQRFEQRWKQAEQDGWIAEAECYRIETPMAAEVLAEYENTDNLRERYMIATENPRKLEIVNELVRKEHREGRTVLVIGEYLEFLRELATSLRAPFVSGTTPKKTRERRFRELKSGKITCLVTSRVGGMALDFPDLDTVIRVTALFGSRQQEAQGWGRALRPKDRKARLYAIVTPNSRDSHFASQRQRFFEEQGYRYQIQDA